MAPISYSKKDLRENFDNYGKHCRDHFKNSEESLMVYRFLKARILKTKCVSSPWEERFTKDLVKYLKYTDILYFQCF